MNFTKEERDQLEATSAVAWALFNDFKTETGDKLELHDRKYLIDVFQDNRPSIVVKKSAQVAFSTTFIIKAFHLARFAHMNIGYTLPTKTIVQDFVKPKVNPIILQNPAIKKEIVEDSQTLKKVRDRFIYFRGAFEEKQAISISLDCLLMDEVDRCFTDPNIEILTKKGWKKITDITIDDYIPSLHPGSHRVSYKKPKSIIKIPYEGNVYRFQARSIDFEVTENHKLWSRIYHPSIAQKYKLHKAKDLYKTKFVLNSKGMWGFAGKTPELVNLPYIERLRKIQHDTRKGRKEKRKFYSRKVLAKSWYSFLGWYLSEGCIHYGRNSINHRKATGSVCITQKNKVYIEEIKQIIRELGYIPRVYEGNQGVKSIQFTSQQIAFYLQRLGKSYEKYIPKRWIWNCHPKYLNYLLDTLLKGDGDSRGVISTVSKRLADDIQIVALRAGKSVAIKKLIRNKPKERDIYRVNINERTYRRFNGFKRSHGLATVTKSYKKCTAYCIELPPYHTFLFRKNGNLPFWSGNSISSILEAYKSRLMASKFRWIWRFSNPSIPQGGVDYYYNLSDKKEWFMRCKHCGHRSFATWEPLERYKTHFVNVEKEELVCGKCGKQLTNEDRRDGEWVAEYPDKKISGYHLSHLMCDWITIPEIVEDSAGRPGYFYNFVLGEPYVTKDIVIDRETIIKCLAPSKPKDVFQYFLGVDTKAGPKHWVLGCMTRDGQKWIRGYGMTESWNDIERIMNTYNTMTVIDANPYPQYPRKLTIRYPGRCFMHWFREDTKNVGVIRWGRSSPAAPEEIHKVFSDRTMIIDDFVYALNNQEILYTMSLPQIEDYVAHLTIMYRALMEQTAEPGTQPIEKPAWVTPEGKPDDWAFASFYCYVAMHRAVLSSGRSIKLRSIGKEPEKPWHVMEDNTIKRPEMNILDLLKKSMKKKRRMYR